MVRLGKQTNMNVAKKRNKDDIVEGANLKPLTALRKNKGGHAGLTPINAKTCKNLINVYTRK